MTDEPLVSMTLNPFAQGNADTLTEMVLEVMDEIAKEDAVEALLWKRSFQPQMINDMDQSLTVGDALTAHLGQGFWTDWIWSADEARQILSRVLRRRELLKWAMDQYDEREKKIHGYVRGLH